MNGGKCLSAVVLEIESTIELDYGIDSCAALSVVLRVD